MNEDCEHAIGTAEIEYTRDMIHLGDDSSGLSRFSGFNFCPYCGVDVTDHAAEMRSAVRTHWEEFWKWYGDTHGEAEMRRARAGSSE